MQRLTHHAHPSGGQMLVTICALLLGCVLPWGMAVASQPQVQLTTPLAGALDTALRTILEEATLLGYAPTILDRDVGFIRFEKNTELEYMVVTVLVAATETPNGEDAAAPPNRAASSPRPNPGRPALILRVIAQADTSAGEPLAASDAYVLAARTYQRSWNLPFLPPVPSGSIIAPANTTVLGPVKHFHTVGECVGQIYLRGDRIGYASRTKPEHSWESPLQSLVEVAANDIVHSEDSAFHIKLPDGRNYNFAGSQVPVRVTSELVLAAISYYRQARKPEVQGGSQ